MKQVLNLFIFLYFSITFSAVQAQTFPITQFSNYPTNFKYNSDSVVYIKNSVIVIPPIFAFNPFYYRDSTMKKFKEVGLFGGKIEKYFLSDPEALYHFHKFSSGRKTSFICKGILYPGFAIATIIVAQNNTTKTSGPPAFVIPLVTCSVTSAIIGSVISFTSKSELKKAVNCMRTKKRK